MTEATLLGWAVCANIPDHLRGGREPERIYQGTRMFSAGTKVWLGKARWQRLHVIGLRRISRDFVNCIIGIDMLVNLRTASIYSPTTWAMLQRLKAQTFDNQADAAEYQARVESDKNDYLQELLQRKLPNAPAEAVPDQGGF